MLDHQEDRRLLMRVSNQKPRGFTLIELMITLVILAVLTVLGIPAFYEMINNMQVRAAAESILDGLQIARAEAVRRNVYTQFVLNADTGWAINEISPPTACGGVVAVIQTRSGGEGSKNATVSMVPAGANTITFTPMSRATNACTVTAVDTTKPHWIQFNIGSTVLDSTQERPLEIRITANGGIRMCSPWVGDANDLNLPSNAGNWHLPVGDPRRC